MGSRAGRGQLLGHARRKALGVIARQQGRGLAEVAGEAQADISERGDGDKRHVVRDLDRELVRAVGLTPANQPEAEVTDAQLADLKAHQAEVGEWQIDRA